jgi:hypothetical protein
MLCLFYSGMYAHLDIGTYNIGYDKVPDYQYDYFALML